MPRVTSDEYFSIIPEWVLYADISANAVRLYATLRRYADRDGGGAYPSRRTLGERMGCSVDTVDRALRELVDLGAVAVESRKVEGTKEQDTNAYVVASVRTGGRKDAATGGRKDAATGGRKDAAGTYNQLTDNHMNQSFRDPIVEGLVDRFTQQIEQADVRRYKVTDAWFVEMERLIRIDGRSPEEIRRVMDWLDGDDFWRPNVLTVPKFREKFDRLRLLAKRTNTKGRGGGGMPSEDELVAAMRRDRGDDR